MESKQEGRRGQSAVFSVFNIRRGVKTAGGGGVNISMRTALIASLAAALAFAGCRGGDSEDDVIGNTPSGDSLKINPASVSIARGNARQFNATSGNSVVNWDIEGKHSDGTIIYPNGNLKIAEDETAAILTVVASLISDSYKKGTAVVTITPPAMPATEVNSFSNGKGTAGSAIDMIRVAKLSLQSFVMLELNSETETETVGLDDIDKDIDGGMLLDNTNSPAEVVIDGGNRAITLTSSGTDPVITVGTGVTLTLRNITFEGKDNNNAPLVRVNGGRLVLEDGAHITGNTSIYGDGGGVYVAGGSFEMSGGTIDHNSGVQGGGVYVSGGSFKMSGGTIYDNSASGKTNSGGGGVYVYGGSFEMSGGTIYDNSGNYGGGVFVDTNGSFEMSGGTIDHNSGVQGGGIYVYGGSFEMSGNALVSGNEAAGSGGGVALTVGAVLTITGNAKISNNEAGEAGGGISSGNDGNTITMSGSAKISGNKASKGGGVEVNQTTFTMEDGKISGNQATGNGGGVYVCAADGSTFKTKIGIIYGSGAYGTDSDGNDLKNTAASGAAVYVEDDSASEFKTTTDKTIIDGVEQGN